MGFGSRKPSSNDKPKSKDGLSPWLSVNELVDEFALLLNGRAKRCVVCKRATDNQYLDSDQRCPDCRKKKKNS
mgnify:FL=1